MSDRRIYPVQKLYGKPNIPGDKSVSHRGLIFGAIAHGTSRIFNLLESADVLSTLSCLRHLGVRIDKKGDETLVFGNGAESFIKPENLLDCGNSGTTIRLLMGLLAGIPNMEATLSGDASLVRRPMKRVAGPLQKMGAEIKLTNNDYAPLTVQGKMLRGFDHDLTIASAQIKTAIVLAALHAEGVTHIRGEIHSRDHTERLLPHFGINVETNGSKITIAGHQKLHANDLKVPGDPSTAAFWLAAASLIPGSAIELKNISLNPTRTGFIQVLTRMGGNIQTEVTTPTPEPIGTIQASYSNLKGVTIAPEEVPSLIDELPLIAVLATQAHGVTSVSGAEELRVKETDRIEAVAENLRAGGIKVETTKDGFTIEGPQEIQGARFNSFHDHRIAMAFSIAGLIARGESTILGSECVGISYPQFYSTLEELTR